MSNDKAFWTFWGIVAGIIIFAIILDTCFVDHSKNIKITGDTPNEIRIEYKDRIYKLIEEPKPKR